MCWIRVDREVSRRPERRNGMEKAQAAAKRKEWITADNERQEETERNDCREREQTI